MIEEYMWIVWLVAVVVAVIVEAISAELISVWFAAGALFAMIVSFIPNVPWWVEIIIFVVISASAFILLRPFLKKFMKHDLVKTNVDEIVGKKAVVTISGNLHQPGEVFVDGKKWSAIPEKEDQELEEDEIVVVLAIQGVKLVVRKEEEK